MTPNRLYAQCREEAKKTIIEKYPHPSEITTLIVNHNELEELTAEIYAMKLLEVANINYQPSICNRKIEFWQKWNLQSTKHTTQQLHDYLVQQFNSENI